MLMSPLRTASSTAACRRMVVGFWAVGDPVGHPACCVMVLAGFHSVRVSSTQYRGQVLNRSQVWSSVWSQMHLVYPSGMQSGVCTIGSVG